MISAADLLLPLAAMLAKGFVVLALAGLATLVLRRAPAATRYAAWALGMAAILALPVLTSVVPEWAVRIPVAGPSSAYAVSDSAAWPGHANAPHDPSPVSHARRSASIAVAPPASLGERRPSPAAPAVGNTSPMAQLPAGAVAWPDLVLACWLLGVTVALSRLVMGLRRVRATLRRAHPLEDRSWRDLIEECVARLGLRSDPVVLSSPDISVPMTCGWRRPVVLLPRAAAQWSASRRRVVLLHELAHVHRADFAMHVLAHATAALHWCNPLAWIALRRMRAERERACDDRVLAAGTQAPEYAQHLLDIARALASRDRLPVAAMAMARRSELEGRLLAILDPARRRTTTAPRVVLFACTLFALVVLPTAAVRVSTVAEAFPLTAEESLLEAQAPSKAQTAPQTPSPRPAAQPAPQPTQSAPQPAQPAPKPAPGPVPGGVAGGVPGGVKGGVGAPKPSPGRGPDGAREALDPATRDRVVQSLVEALNDSSPEVRQQAVHALANIRTEKAFEPMLRALKDSDADVRQHAAQALGQMGDPRAVDPLLRALEDSNADVRAEAACALGELGAKQASGALARALKDATVDVRAQAARALGQLGDPSVTAALSAAIADANAEVRQQVLRALGELRASGAATAITQALKDSIPDVRAEAARALGEIGSPAAIEALSQAMRDVNVEVRQQVIQALSQIVEEQERLKEEQEQERDNDDDQPEQPLPPAPQGPQR
jgi:HEAT repeat protein/beta-lactamase regulating signal transducer with metallopeptidase domain